MADKSAPKARAAADQNEPNPGNSDPLPTNGVREGRFYFLKQMAGKGEIPDSVHADNAEEIRLMARNQGNQVADAADVNVAQAAKTGDGWDVIYSVPIDNQE